MAKLLDAHGSGPCAFGCEGSSPSFGTKRINTAYLQTYFYIVIWGHNPIKQGILSIFS